METTVIYKRNIRRQLLALRLIQTSFLTLIIYFLFIKTSDYAILFIVLFIPTLIISLTEITVWKDSINIKTFALSGLSTKSIELNTKNILSMTPHEDLLEIDESALYESNHSFDFLLLLFPTRVLVTNVTEFIYTDTKGEMKTLRAKLKTEEYKIIWETLNGQMH